MWNRVTAMIALKCRIAWTVKMFLIATGIATSAQMAGGSVLVEAHRGASFAAPENTNASIDAAVGSADLTEFDVRVTADGELVLMHDSTVDRTTNGTGAVDSLTLAQIKTLDAGSWFSPAFAGEQVPTLSEAINFSLSVGIEPLIERKSGSAATYNNALMSMGLAPTDFRVISFNWSFLADMNTLNPDYNLGILSSGTLDQSVINTAKSLGIDFLDWNQNGITQATVDLVQANGMELHVYTVNNPTRMQQLIDFGVDGITTDLPETLQKLVIQSSQTADLNNDEVVDEADWLIYNANRGVDFTGMSLAEARDMGDLDGDLDNDARDFTIFKSLYLAAGGSTPFETMAAETLAFVPEPTTAMLSVSSFAWLMSFGRPRRTRRNRRDNRGRYHRN